MYKSIDLTSARCPVANFALFFDFDAFAFLLYACHQPSFRVLGLPEELA
jgi:hypothetical protein